MSEKEMHLIPKGKYSKQSGIDYKPTKLQNNSQSRLSALHPNWIFVNEWGHMRDIYGRKNVVCTGGEQCAWKQGSQALWNACHVSFCYLFNVTRIQFSKKILPSDESFLKLSLSNDKSQTGLLNPNCQGLRQRHKTWKKWARCWS